MEVEYRDVVDRPGYRVGSDGSIWSCWKNPRHIGTEWKQMSGGSGGYYGHRVIGFAGRQYRMVHRLVLEAFVGPCPEGMECCHIDGDPTNNRVENLRWGTSKENKQDQIRHGNSRRGEKNAGNILSEDQVRTILAKLGQGVTRGQLSREYKTTRENIRNIQLGFTWRHVSGLPQPPEEAAARSRAQAAARERRRLKRELCK